MNDAQFETASLEVSVESGRLRGFMDAGLVRFRGVPYAQAARFEEPTPAAPWSGIRDASVHGFVCPQPQSPLDDVMGIASPTQQGEDCLTLCITAPATRSASPRPVMVWLHGGAYLVGAGSYDWYDAAALVQEGDVVVVRVNYRLGVFGYMHWPGVCPANLGVCDQLAALRWICRNIAAFGGDPNRVTLFGQSAGGHAVAALMSTPETRGLFQRAIIQSAHLGVGFTKPARAARVAQLVQRALEGEDPRTCSAQRLLQAQQRMSVQIAGPAQLDATPAFGPIAGAPPLTAAGSITKSPSEQRPDVDLIGVQFPNCA